MKKCKLLDHVIIKLDELIFTNKGDIVKKSIVP